MSVTRVWAHLRENHEIQFCIVWMRTQLLTQHRKLRKTKHCANNRVPEIGLHVSLTMQWNNFNLILIWVEQTTKVNFVSIHILIKYKLFLYKYSVSTFNYFSFSWRYEYQTQRSRSVCFGPTCLLRGYSKKNCILWNDSNDLHSEFINILVLQNSNPHSI